MKTKKTITRPDDRTPETDQAEWAMDQQDLKPLAKLSEYARLARSLERQRNVLAYHVKSGQADLLKMLVNIRIRIETMDNFNKPQTEKQMETRHTHREIDSWTIGRNEALTYQILEGIRRREERASRKGGKLRALSARLTGKGEA